VSTVAPTAERELSTVRFGRRSSRGLLLGLSAPRVAAVAAAFTVVLPCVYAGGLRAVMWGAPVWATLIGSAFLRISGRTAVDWLPVAGHWALRRATGQTSYAVRVLEPRPAGTLALPGDAAALRVHIDVDTDAAMVHDPHAHTLTAVARVRHAAFVLLGPGDQQRRLAGWGRVYATAAQSGRICRLQVLQRTLPDSGRAVAQHWTEHGVRDASPAALAYDELVEAAGPASARHETTVSISVDLTRARRAVRAEGGGMTGGAAVLRREMMTVAAALRSAEITVDGWLDPADLAVLLRTAYDPAAGPVLDRNPVGREVGAAGPVAVREYWDHLRTDSGIHAVYWISEWPRSDVYPSFLSPVLLAAGISRTFSLVAQPLTTTEAMRAIRKERVEYQADAAQRQRIGQLTDAATEQELADVNQRERDLVAGHGDLRYAGFLSVTAADYAGLQAARSAIEQAAIQAGCETRLLVGQQAQAFAAAALPLCRGI